MDLTKTGEIARLVSDRAFGFIKLGRNKDIFFHKKDCKTPYEELKQGDQVSFIVENTDKGQRAVGVERIDDDQ